ncbi:hypothetical protein GC088_08380 [Arthrobacter sp. JZ12]|uniref:hypothetical protein n=1 Tax=Arthrobacter sp. JZ12 TaxID=2654190 RepID=UPI002B47708D|nr:hypothetical protein [Arthrobacter sp. JZ12]WRH25081.1 hypothetical protein GC088_08380 [Arthrobacter sp. JZ12]
MPGSSTLARELTFAEPQVVSDLRTYVGRARAAQDGAVRLQAEGRVLAAYVSILAPRILGEGTPTVLGLRTMPLAEPARLDTTVGLASVSDRLARMGEHDVVLPVPPTTVTENWAGVLPPRSGWTPAGTVGTDSLLAAASDGIREVAQTVPNSPGAIVVNNARGVIWARPIDGAPAGLPAGAAFGAYALGFLAPEQDAQVLTNGRWTRLSTAGGHVLVRQAAVL